MEGGPLILTPKFVFSSSATEDCVFVVVFSSSFFALIS